MKPKLLVLTSTYPRWENDSNPPFVHELSNRLAKDFEIYVLTPHYTGSASEEKLDGVKVKRFRYFFSRYEKLAGSIGILPQLKNNRFYWIVAPFYLLMGLYSTVYFAIKNRPDVIHAHWIIPQGVYAALANKIFDIPFVVTGHGADIFDLKNWLIKQLRSFTIINAEQVTVVSNALGKHLKVCVKLKNRVNVLPMGVDHQLFKGTKSIDCKWAKVGTKCNIIFVGRLTEKKGVSYLIDAISLLKDQLPQIHLTIVGDGEMRASLQNLAMILNLSERVTFTGAIPNSNLPQLYDDHLIFIGPSIETKSGDTEGFGLTFVEASMAGCLLIGTDVGGISDIIEHGKTGFLVQQKCAESIAEKISYCISNSAIIPKIVKQGQNNNINKYSWYKISAKYSNLINMAMLKNT